MSLSVNNLWELCNSYVFFKYCKILKYLKKVITVYTTIYTVYIKVLILHIKNLGGFAKVSLYQFVNNFCGFYCFN